MAEKIALKRLFDLNSILPCEHGQVHHNDSPRFYGLETSLILPSSGCLLVGFACVMMALAEWIGVFTSVNPDVYSTVDLLPVALISFLVGFAGFHTIHCLARRTINEEQFEWMVASYNKLGMPRPCKTMTKLDLKEYVGKAYKLQSQRESLI